MSVQWYKGVRYYAGKDAYHWQGEPYYSLADLKRAIDAWLKTFPSAFK